MTRHVDEDLCLDLLLSALPAEREREVLSHLESCPACDDLFRTRAAEMERIMLASPYRAGFLAAKAVPEGADRTWKRWIARPRGAIGSIRRPAFAWTAATAVLAAVVVLLILPRGRGDDSAFAPFWLPAGADIGRHRAGPEQSGQKELAEGIAAYDRRDLAEAIRILSHAPTDGALEQVRLVYLGNSLSLIGEPGKAIGILRSIRIPYLPEPWSGEVQWTLLVALRRTGKTASADSLQSLLRKRSDEIGRRASGAPLSR